MDMRTEIPRNVVNMLLCYASTVLSNFKACFSVIQLYLIEERIKLVSRSYIGITMDHASHIDAIPYFIRRTGPLPALRCFLLRFFGPPLL